MNRRDKLNTPEGYHEILNQNSEFIESRVLKIKAREDDERNGVQNYPRKNVEIIQAAKKQIFTYQVDSFKANFSLGKDLPNMKKEFQHLFEIFSEIWQSEWGYVQMVEMLSIGIMFEIEDEDFNQLVNLVERDNVNDFLIDFLIQYRLPSWQRTEKFLWNKPYKNSIKIIEDSKIDNEKAISSLKKYLKSWYSSLEVKTHESKWNIHTGYWSWEAGAIAKILNIDDISLKDQPYYPYDMVHYKD